MSVVQTVIHLDTLTLAHISKLNFFEPLANPVADFTLLDMHELHTNLTAIGLPVSSNKIAKLPLGLLFRDCARIVGHADGDLSFKVSVGKAVMRGVEQGEE